MAIASLEELKLLLRLEQPGDDTFAELCLITGEQNVRSLCGRSFDAPSGSSVTYRFVPTSPTLCYVYDLASTSGVAVTNDGATVAAVDMQFEPVNQRSRAMEYTPFTAIRLKAGYWIDRGAEATVSVTSTQWGWTGGCPSTVKRAVLEHAKDLFQFKDMRGGVAGFGEFGAIRLRENPAIRMMLEPAFIRYDLVGIA